MFKRHHIAKITQYLAKISHLTRIGHGRILYIYNIASNRRNFRYTSKPYIIHNKVWSPIEIYLNLTLKNKCTKKYRDGCASTKLRTSNCPDFVCDYTYLTILFFCFPNLYLEWRLSKTKKSTSLGALSASLGMPPKKLF